MSKRIRCGKCHLEFPDEEQARSHIVRRHGGSYFGGSTYQSQPDDPSFGSSIFDNSSPAPDTPSFDSSSIDSGVSASSDFGGGGDFSGGGSGGDF